ncbi:hypothetical protein FK498_00745 [Elioraea sp. Yellowstone]|jgi:hypothetical protein|uniref:hypothetical protein n=1 Tax=Elioraea sp. Yellowstone TaxID=2592070 RepID=UPI00114DE2FE|nr:hypothetical protein [Elioraea sp. Yellowstone]TQF85249.1 hypothetical protein FK498_00745 [Elioraea sp. Yellowstone]
MSEFLLRIRTDGAAFMASPTAEIARILRRLADEMDRLGFAGAWPRPLHDSDGNRVGQAEFTFTPPRDPSALARWEPGEA